MTSIPIIETQLMPPTIKDQYIRRARLHRKLSAIPEFPLTFVHSGAGYGKSTALALFTHEQKTNYAWYSTAVNDDDFLPFLTKWVHAIRRPFPEFGEKTLSQLYDMNHYIGEEEVFSFVTTFVHEVMELREEVCFILDDYHLVQDSLAIKRWMQTFLQHIPANFHLVIASRVLPEWQELSTMKVKGQALEINQHDLTFSEGEISHLLHDIYQVSLSEEDLAQIVKLTEGWAIAFTMLVQHLQFNTTMEDIMKNKQDSLQELFNYLAHEVLAEQSMMAQQFLEQTSILESMDPKSCDAILDMSGSAPMLEKLASKHLFIQRLDHSHYRYHALFKEFLENRLAAKDQQELIELHLRAAKYYKQRQQIEQAMNHLKEVKAYNQLADDLVFFGDDLLKNGRLQALKDYLFVLPNRYKDRNPKLWYYQGEICRYRNNYENAEKSYNRTSELAGHKDNGYLISLALEGKACIYLDTIQPDLAERILQQAIQLREGAHASKEDMGRLYHLLAENLLNAGQAVKAEAWLNRAKSLDLPLRDGNLEARILLRTGRLEKAKRLLLSKKMKENDDSQLPQSHRETDVLLSIIESFLGNAEEAKGYAQEGINLGVEVQSPFVEACGWIRMGHAVHLIPRYEDELAVECYQTALDIMEKLNVSRGKAEPLMGLSILYGWQKRFEKSFEIGEMGLEETKKVKDVWLSSLIQLSLGLSSIYCEQLEKASTLIRQVELQFEQCGDSYGFMLTSFWQAYIALKTEDEDGFSKHIKVFLEHVHTNDYEFFLKKRTTFGPADLSNFAPMLMKARYLNICQQYVNKLMDDLDLTDFQHHPGYTLSITTLGGLQLKLGQEPVKEKDWQRSKARELFELLVTKRHRMVMKDEIYQELWPGQSEESSNRNFKVTMNALLKTLEPNRKARGEPFFIKRNGSAYGLNKYAGYTLDSAQMEESVTSGLDEKDPLKAERLLKQGLQFYKGDYLPERHFEHWCLNERERLQVLFLRGAERIAQIYTRLEQYDPCIHWSQKIIQNDQTWEEAYRLLMYCYYQKGNRPQAMKWYQRCEEVLESELGVDPMPPTKDMYLIIKSSGDIQVFA
ncbi:BTAD domain-containing putative transcriptional regulator [Halobacillus hunanensis]|uniref:BTAD domain-containing putative transcriptional regulator n=1 Tax=Halobacillus hunanensis TaxID=578214 RepID=UPI001FE3584E|nr:BTAD domain-containing putative transcriptional regulator [Halobacillus hunanensis]